LECAFLSLSLSFVLLRVFVVFPQSRRHKNSSFTTREKRKALLVAAVKARACFGQRPFQRRRRRLLGPNKVVVFFFSIMRRKISKAKRNFFVLSNAKKMFTTQKKKSTHKIDLFLK